MQVANKQFVRVCIYTPFCTLQMAKSFKRGISLVLSTISLCLYGYNHNHNHNRRRRIRLTNDVRYYSYNMPKSSRPLSLQVCWLLLITFIYMRLCMYLLFCMFSCISTITTIMLIRALIPNKQNNEIEFFFFFLHI